MNCEIALYPISFDEVSFTFSRSDPEVLLGNSTTLFNNLDPIGCPIDS